MNEKRLCPLNRFKRCRENACACFLVSQDGAGECSFLSLGHLDFTLAAIGQLIAQVNRPEKENEECKK